MTLRLHRKMHPQLDAASGLKYMYENIEIPVSVVLQKIERNGVLIDARAAWRRRAPNWASA